MNKWIETSKFKSSPIRLSSAYHCTFDKDKNMCMYYLKNHIMHIIKDHPEIKTICICGSTFYKECFETVSKVFELNGIIALRPSIYSNYDKINLSSNELDVLMDVFRRKIDISDAVLVLDINKRIGIHTATDIAYAKSVGKDIIYLSKE